MSKITKVYFFVIVFLFTGIFTISAQVVTSSLDDGSTGTLRNQILSATPGSIITINTGVTDIVLTNGEITVDKTLTLIGNGWPTTTIDGDANGRVFNVTNGTFTVLELTVTNGLADNGGAFNLINSNLVLEAVQVSNSVANGTSGSGGGVFVGTGSNLTATACIFTGNSSNRAGGAIESVAGTNVILNEVELSENATGVVVGPTAPGNGGAFHITGNGTATLTESSIFDNTAANEGGGLWNGTSIMTVTSCTISGNIASGAAADSGGGGIYINNGGTLNLLNTTISNNIANGAAGSGGGILVDNGATLNAVQSIITGNRSNRAGGGIESVANTTTNLTDVDLMNNNTGVAPAIAAPGNGGGFHITGNGNATIIRGNVTNNVAGLEGGGLWNGAGTMTVTDAIITGNSASGNTDLNNNGGGGVFNQIGTIVIEDSMISNNSATGPNGLGGGILNDGASLTLTNTMVMNNSADKQGGGLWNNNGMVMINQDSKFDGNMALGSTAPVDGGGGIYIFGGTVTINDSELTNNKAIVGGASGGAIFNFMGTLNATEVLISENISNRAGGGIEAAAGSSTNLNDVTLSSNNTGVLPDATASSPGNGGGLHITGNGSAMIMNSIVQNNVAAAEGGGLWNGAGTMTITDTQITANTASGAGADNGGGGIYNLNGGTLSITDSVISNNVADGAAGSGGGILNDQTSTLTVTNSTISGNTANRAGGGIEGTAGASSTNFITLNNVTLTDNIVFNAPGNGGGLHMTGPGTIMITEGLVTNNTAGSEGGGLWNGTGTMTIDGTTISGNIAQGNDATNGGGGIYNLNGGVLTITNATISNNMANGTAGSGGGILNDVGSTVDVSNSTISGNSASRAGGGIEAVGTGATSTVVLNEVMLNNNTALNTPGNGGGLHITGPGTVTVNGGTVNNNTAGREGGGLWNDSGLMTVTGTTFADNMASGAAADDGGGALFNVSGTLSVDESIFTGNKATGALGSGGALFSLAGDVEVLNSTFDGNSANRAGGAIEVVNGTLLISNSDFMNNDVDGNAGTPAPGNGGALHITGATVTTITGGVVSGNLARREGGGLWNQTGSTMTVTGVQIDGNIAKGPDAIHGGGGIFNNGGDLFVNNSSIYNNESTGANGNGGGIHIKTGSAMVMLSTISGNSSANTGGGVYSNAGLMINASTIAFNDAVANGGGVSNDSATPISLKNTIVSNNMSATNSDVYSSTSPVTSNGYNLIQVASPSFTSVATDIVGVDPLLGMLADNGGSLLTHALQSGSPAYNFGDPMDLFDDQIGNPVFGDVRDIGALEAQEILGTDSFVFANSKQSILYPNPSNGIISIDLSASFGTQADGFIVEIGSGKIVKQFGVQDSSSTVDLSVLANGVYVIQLTSENVTETHKLVLNK